MTLTHHHVQDLDLLGHALRLQAKLLEEDGWDKLSGALRSRAKVLETLDPRKAAHDGLSNAEETF